MNVDYDGIYAYYQTLKAIGEYKSFYEYSENKCTFSSAFSNEISVYHYFEDIVNSHYYLNELHEIFRKYNCFVKFCYSPLKIYIFFKLDEKIILISTFNAEENKK